ncbi:MAG: 23S rRNA (adenine(2030)-N(6))-methyltransferase RlmJ [Bdellovibrionales bacterium]|jgi:23S rRNA (adenine2030-N6)-methyltransferase
MNYRHIYHAGNRPDVVKHAVLTILLRALREKEKGFAVLDTHAGCGLYDLNDPRAQKTGEAAEGILNLLEADPLPALADYMAVLRKVNPLWSGKGAEGFRVYPGSPLFSFHRLREQDRLVACELHPDDAKALRALAPADKRFQIHARDGYEALGAFLPPPEKRGLVLIDPPYEQQDEFDVLLRRVGEAHRRWTTGIFMIWYPVKDRPAIWKFQEALAAAGIPKILCAEFVYDENVSADHLGGSGMIVINPPWKLDEEIRALFPALHGALKTPYAGDVVRWLTE